MELRISPTAPRRDPTMGRVCGAAIAVLIRAIRTTKCILLLCWWWLWSLVNARGNWDVKVGKAGKVAGEEQEGRQIREDSRRNCILLDIGNKSRGNLNTTGREKLSSYRRSFAEVDRFGTGFHVHG
jgi:hypothetical protein